MLSEKGEEYPGKGGQCNNQRDAQAFKNPPPDILRAQYSKQIISDNSHPWTKYCSATAD
jgi:hypothetical protein